VNENRRKNDMAKARFTTTRSISYDDEFDLEPCLALLRGDRIDEHEEMESNPRVVTASVVDADDADDVEYDVEYHDPDDEYDDPVDEYDDPDEEYQDDE